MYMQLNFLTLTFYLILNLFCIILKFIFQKDNLKLQKLKITLILFLLHFLFVNLILVLLSNLFACFWFDFFQINFQTKCFYSIILAFTLTFIC